MCDVHIGQTGLLVSTAAYWQHNRWRIPTTHFNKAGRLYWCDQTGWESTSRTGNVAIPFGNSQTPLWPINLYRTILKTQGTQEIGQELDLLVWSIKSCWPVTELHHVWCSTFQVCIRLSLTFLIHSDCRWCHFLWNFCIYLEFCVQVPASFW